MLIMLINCMYDVHPIVRQPCMTACQPAFQTDSSSYTS